MHCLKMQSVFEEGTIPVTGKRVTCFVYFFTCAAKLCFLSSRCRKKQGLLSASLSYFSLDLCSNVQTACFQM